METNILKQCLLQHGDMQTIAWIPEKFAKRGKWLDLQGDFGNWSTGWLVVDCFSTRLTQDYVREHQRADFGSIQPTKA